MRAILVSSCLLGEPVRYDGSAAPIESRTLDRWRVKARLVAFCPELAAGMPVPRNATEIRGGDGNDVLDGSARVVDCTQEDVTEAYVQGAHAELGAARECGAAMAILKETSPSCGSCLIYDGSFTSTLLPGVGVTAALLSRNGIRVFSEDRLDEAEGHMRTLEAASEAPTGRPERP